MISKLINAISLLTRELTATREQEEKKFDWLRSHAGLATKNDLKEMEKRIMSKLSDYLEKQRVYNERHEAAIAAAVAAVTGLTADIADLNKQIIDLQNSSGGVTPEDAERIDKLETDGAALIARAEAASEAIQLLDAQKDSAPTPPTA